MLDCGCWWRTDNPVGYFVFGVGSADVDVCELRDVYVKQLERSSNHNNALLDIQCCYERSKVSISLDVFD